MGEIMCWHGIVALEAKDTCQDKVCKQSHYVWRMPWVQKNYHFILWQTKDNDVVATGS